VTRPTDDVPTSAGRWRYRSALDVAREMAGAAALASCPERDSRGRCRVDRTLCLPHRGCRAGSEGVEDVRG
jgi:hypothetical protein